MRLRLKVFFGLVIVVCSLYLGQYTYTYGQETTEPTDPQVVTTENKTGTLEDPTTAAVSVLGIAGASTAILKSVIDERKAKKNIKGTDVDFTYAMILLGKIFQVAYEADPKWKAVLDTRTTSNVMDKETLGEAFTKEVNGWAAYIQEAYNVARPSMSIPSVQKIDPTNSNKSNETQKPLESK